MHDLVGYTHSSSSVKNASFSVCDRFANTMAGIPGSKEVAVKGVTRLIWLRSTLSTILTNEVIKMQRHDSRQSTIQVLNSS